MLELLRILDHLTKHGSTNGGKRHQSAPEYEDQLDKCESYGIQTQNLEIERLSRDLKLIFTNN